MNVSFLVNYLKCFNQAHLLPSFILRPLRLNDHKLASRFHCHSDADLNFVHYDRSVAVFV